MLKIRLASREECIKLVDADGFDTSKLGFALKGIYYIGEYQGKPVATMNFLLQGMKGEKYLRINGCYMTEQFRKKGWFTKFITNCMNDIEQSMMFSFYRLDASYYSRNIFERLNFKIVGKKRFDSKNYLIFEKRRV